MPEQETVQTTALEAKAILRYARISSRKVKIVADLIRGKDVATARNILETTNTKASTLIFSKKSPPFLYQTKQNKIASTRNIN